MKKFYNGLEQKRQAVLSHFFVQRNGGGITQRNRNGNETNNGTAMGQRTF